MMDYYRRPPSLILFPLVYLLAAPGVLFVAALVNMVPLVGAGSVLGRLAPADVLALLCYPAAAVAVFSVRPFGWRVFILCSAYLLIHNFAAFLLNPFVSAGATLLFNTLLTAGAAYFFRRHTIAPYFNPRLRAWETAPRFSPCVKIELRTGEDTAEAELEDLSMGGAFVRLGGASRSFAGAAPVLRLFAGRHELHLSSKVVREIRMQDGSLGLGLMFLPMTPDEKARLVHALDSLDSLLTGAPQDSAGSDRRSQTRLSLRLPMVLRLGGTVVPAYPDNISETGIAVLSPAARLAGVPTAAPMSDGTADQADADTAASGSEAELEIRGRKDIRLACRIVWMRSIEQGVLRGLRFAGTDREARRLLRSYVRFLKGMRAKLRQEDAAVMEAILNETLLRSPYRFVAAIKRGLGIKSR